MRHISSAHHHGLPAQFRVAQELDGRKKGIHIQMSNSTGRRIWHQNSFVSRSWVFLLSGGAKGEHGTVENAALQAHITRNSGDSCNVKTWFLYLIECTDGSIYTGITTDVAARFAAHCRGKGARYTRAHPPLRILGVISYPDRSSASKAEYAVKQLSAQQKRRLFTSSGQIPADISAPSDCAAASSHR